MFHQQDAQHGLRDGDDIKMLPIEKLIKLKCDDCINFLDGYCLLWQTTRDVPCNGWIEEEYEEE